MLEDIRDQSATVMLLHVAEAEENLLISLINRIWFYYDLEKISTRDQQRTLFQNVIYTAQPAPFQMLITTLGRQSPLDPILQTHLMLYLKQQRCPLISLGTRRTIEIVDQDPNWLHIALPGHITASCLVEANDAIANFWFNLPAES